MNKTERYQLNQWEASDRILREDFNQDNLTVETALATLDGAVSAEKTAREAAVTAAKSEASSAVAAESSARTTAINSAVSQLNTSIGTKADKSTVTALTNTVNALPFVKIASVTTSAAAAQINVSLGGAKLTDYAYFLIVPKLNAGGAVIQLRLNNNTTACCTVGSSSSFLAHIATLNDLNKSTSGQFRLLSYLSDGTIQCLSENMRDGSYGTTCGKMPGSNLTGSALTTLNFVSSTGTNFAAGGKIVVYGVKW